MTDKVVQRDGSIVSFEPKRIKGAILRAFNSPIAANEIEDVNIIAREMTKEISSQIEKRDIPILVDDIENIVYRKINKMSKSAGQAYRKAREVRELRSRLNTTDTNIEGLLDLTYKEAVRENSNKDAKLISTQRDLIAGEISKDIARRKLVPPHLVLAHDTGAIHIHDLDYMMQPMFNCCLINLEDMLTNGTVINDKLINTPNSFQVAATVTTQIIAQVASNQYGGQSINGIDRILAPYVRKSYNKYYNMILEDLLDDTLAKKIAWKMTKKEISNGVQTIQYQLQTLMTTNGQSPFVTLFMHFPADYEYAKEAALIQEEILKQRIEGVKNEVGRYITPAFPKLIYVLDEHNIHEDSQYYYLTELAAECTAKRMYPDYISAKKMKELYEGNVFSPMGCRSTLSPWKNDKGEYVFDGRFNMGVVSLNLPQIAIISKSVKDFFRLLDKRVLLVKEALLLRYDLLKGTKSDVSPIHWQHGAIARLKKGESIDKLMDGGYATISMGYIGLYETVKLLIGESHTTEKGKELGLHIIKKLREYCDEWKEETNIGFALYGTPAESLTDRFNRIDRAIYGVIEDVTDKEYYTNSYHVDVREDMSVFDKFKFESEFQTISTGGMISYAEIPNMTHNIDALLTMIEYIYNNITYAEFNTKLDLCHKCNYEAEMLLNDKGTWYCPQCGNNDESEMTVVRRTCGYLGSSYWNEGRTQEINSRVLHI